MGYYTQDEKDDTMQLLHDFCIEPENLHKIISQYHTLRSEVRVEDELQQQNAELTHEILELREHVRRLETKEFLDNMDKDECDYGVATKVDEETWHLEQNNKHMSEVIKFLERKLKEQE